MGMTYSVYFGPFIEVMLPESDVRQGEPMEVWEMLGVSEDAYYDGELYDADQLSSLSIGNHVFLLDDEFDTNECIVDTVQEGLAAFMKKHEAAIDNIKMFAQAEVKFGRVDLFF